jgi:hypothetical protein
MSPRSSRPTEAQAPAHYNLVAGGTAIALTLAVELANCYFIPIIRDYPSHQMAGHVATVFFAAVTFYVNRPSAPAPWWVGCAVMVVGVAAFYGLDTFFFRTQGEETLNSLRNTFDWVLPLSYGLIFGPPAWMAHRALLQSSLFREPDGRGVTAGRSIPGPVSAETGKFVEDAIGLQPVSGCDNLDSVADVVFIHGLGGGSHTTWADQRLTERFWPAWLGEDFPQLGVWVLGYPGDPSRWQSESMPLPDRALVVLDQLRSDRLGEKPLCFVVHSMGGILLKHFLQEAYSGGATFQRIARQTQAVIFIATPHSGAHIASFSKYLPNVLRLNEHVGELAADDAHLSKLHRWFKWYCAEHGLQCRSFCERRELRFDVFGVRLPKGIIVVDATSGDPGLDEAAIPVDADHQSICKPAGRGEPLYKSVHEFLETWLKKLSAAPATPVANQPTAHPPSAPAAECFEIERCDIVVKVWPVPRQPFTVGEGEFARPVSVDNLARITEVVTFSPAPQLAQPFILRYVTKGAGGVGEVSRTHENEAAGADQFRDQRGEQATWMFTPKPGQRYEFGLTVYGGYGEAGRFAKFRLPESHHKQRPAVTFKAGLFTLDLTGYAADCAFEPRPRLVSNWDYDTTATPQPVGVELPYKEDASGTFQWELPACDGCVLNLVLGLTRRSGVAPDQGPAPETGIAARHLQAALTTTTTTGAPTASAATARSAGPTPAEVFYVYSHKDEKRRDQLQIHLAAMKREGLIAGWHDRAIGAGQEWKGQIDQHLNSASVILLLVSPDFIASDYCHDVEMRRALERHDRGEACVIPVILRPTDWQRQPYAKLQALPRGGKPVTKWANKDEALLDVARGIRATLERLTSRRSS